MKHRLSGCLSATLVITAALAGLSSAAVIGGSGVSGYSYTSSISQASSGTFDLKKFDSALGTLTGATITFSLNGWDSSYSFTHNNSVTLNDTTTGGTRVSLKYTGAVSNLAQATASQQIVESDTSYVGAGTQTISGLPAAGDSKVVSRNLASATADGLIGTGVKSFTFTGEQRQNISTSGDSTSNILAQSMTGDITAFVTYTYDEVAAVPEPSEFLLGGVPALFGGFVLMRRRRAVR
jgi:hypothetical protein